MEHKQKYQVFILALTTTLREGIESVLFLTSVGSTTGAASIPIPGILGIFLGIVTGMIVFYRCALSANGRGNGAAVGAEAQGCEV